eukprot:2168434-Prymnesium_polylepis.2
MPGSDAFELCISHTPTVSRCGGAAREPGKGGQEVRPEAKRRTENTRTSATAFPAPRTHRARAPRASPRQSPHTPGREKSTARNENRNGIISTTVVHGRYTVYRKKTPNPRDSPETRASERCDVSRLGIDGENASRVALPRSRALRTEGPI